MMANIKCESCGSEINRRDCKCPKCSYPRCDKCNATLINGRCLETEFQPERQTVNEYLGIE